MCRGLSQDTPCALIDNMEAKTRRHHRVSCGGGAHPAVVNGIENCDITLALHIADTI